MEKLVLGREATEKEVEALKAAQEILDALEGDQLQIIGVLPKPRPRP